MRWNTILTILCIGFMPITVSSQEYQSSRQIKEEGKTEFCSPPGLCKYRLVPHTLVVKPNLET